MIDAGYLVEFIDKNQIILALVQSAKKGRLALISWQDKQLALSEGRVLFSSPSKLNPAAPRARLSEALAAIEKARAELAAQINVAELWELTTGEEQSYSLQNLAELCFAPPVGANQISATLRAIFNDRTYFRLNNQGCEPLTPEQLEQKQMQQAREEQKKARLEEWLAWLKQNLSGENMAGPAPEGLLTLLREWVVWDEEAPSIRQIKELVAAAGLNNRRQAFTVLQRAGELEPHHNLAALREQIPLEFSAQTEEAAAATRVLSDAYGELAGHFFTVDGEDTQDFDDAISFTPRENGGGVLGVHITNLEVIVPDSPLDLEARARGTTLYLPEGPISMLPRSLSEGALSLRAGELRPVISCLAEVSAQGEVVNYSVSANLITVKERLSYPQVDERINQGDKFFNQLYDLSMKLKQKREEANACFLPLPELEIKVGDNWQVDITVHERDGLAREMIAETAILANRLQGELMAAAGVPCLYRVQAMPKEPWQNFGPEALFINFSRRRQLQRVELTLKPGRHAGLGIDTYAHITSPMRRYLDLLMQRQLLAHLQGRALPMDGPKLLETGQQVELSLRAAGRVVMARQRYWVLKWLQQQQGEIVPALVLEQQMRSWQLLLKPVMLIAPIPLQGISKNLTAGAEVRVKILRADPFEDSLRLELAP